MTDSPLFNNPELVEKLIRGNNQFALDLFKRMCVHHGNVLTSPLSISAVLSMLLVGAKGDTAKQLKEVLHLQDFTDEDEEGNNKDLIHVAFQDLLTSISASLENSSAVFRWAHRLYLQTDFPISEDIAMLLNHHYGAGIVEADFGREAEEARLKINTWIGEQIDDSKFHSGIVGEGILDLFTILLALSVSVFEGTWDKPFDEGATHLHPFNVGGGRKVIVDMMRTLEPTDFRHTINEDLGCEVLELPYEKSNLALIVLVPNDSDEFHEFEDKLDVDTVEDLIAQLESKTVLVAMPRFRITSTFTMSDIIGHMGANLLVDPVEADLSGFLADGSELEGEVLSLSALLHGAELRVSEKGTEGSAPALSTECDDEDEESTISIDRPFIFLLRDAISGLILYIGCVHEPSNDDMA